MKPYAGLRGEWRGMLAKGRLTLVVWLCFATSLFAAVDPAHPYAYGANIGWMNAHGDGTNGVELGPPGERNGPYDL